jgi:hypothetical protein
MTTKEKAELLGLVSDYENTEVGDYWLSITNLYNYTKDYMTDEYHLQTGVEIEIQYQYLLDMLDDECGIEMPEKLREQLV